MEFERTNFVAVDSIDEQGHLVNLCESDVSGTKKKKKKKKKEKDEISSSSSMKPLTLAWSDIFKMVTKHFFEDFLVSWKARHQPLSDILNSVSPPPLHENTLACNPSHCFQRTKEEVYWDKVSKSFVKTAITKYALPCQFRCNIDGAFSRMFETTHYYEWYYGVESEFGDAPVNHGERFMVPELPLTSQPIVRCKVWKHGKEDTGDDDVLVKTKTFHVARDGIVLMSTGADVDDDRLYPSGLVYPEMDMTVACKKALSASRTMAVTSRWFIPVSANCGRRYRFFQGVFSWFINGKCIADFEDLDKQSQLKSNKPIGMGQESEKEQPK